MVDCFEAPIGVVKIPGNKTVNQGELVESKVALIIGCAVGIPLGLCVCIAAIWSFVHYRQTHATIRKTVRLKNAVRGYDHFFLSSFALLLFCSFALLLFCSFALLLLFISLTKSLFLFSLLYLSFSTNQISMRGHVDVDNHDYDVPAPPAPANLQKMSRVDSMKSMGRPVSFRMPNGRIQSVRIGRGAAAEPHKPLPAHPSMHNMKMKTSTDAPLQTKKSAMMEPSNEGENTLLTHAGDIELAPMN